MNGVFHVKVRQTLIYTYAIEADSQNKAIKLLKEAIDENDNDLDFVGYKEEDIVCSDYGLLNYVREDGNLVIITPREKKIKQATDKDEPSVVFSPRTHGQEGDSVFPDYVMSGQEKPAIVMPDHEELAFVKMKSPIEHASGKMEL